MTKKRFTKGEWTNCRYDICEILENGEYFCTVATKDVDLIIKVLEENEQLKERNNNQYTQLNRLWGLMEDKDWETMEQMVEEINTAEERLQREWGTYGDVE